MRTLHIIRRLFPRRIARTSWARRSGFTCGDCDRWRRCGFATPRRLYPQSCPDRSRRNTGQAFAPACLLSGGRSVAATVQKFSIASAMPRGSSSARRKAARPSRIAVCDVVANTWAIARPSSPTLSSGTSRVTRPRQSHRWLMSFLLPIPDSCTAANDVRVGPLWSAGLAPLRILSWDMESDFIPR